MERFREYIKTMTDAKTGDLALPLLTERPFSDPALTRPILKADQAGRIPGPAMPLGSARTKPFHRLA